MHFCIFVITNNQPVDLADEDAIVADALAEHYKQHWDWYQVGGRWTGFLQDYDPGKDPANLEDCDRCNATGVMNNQQARNGEKCPRCEGAGQNLKWPTSWKRIGSTVPVKAAIQEQATPYAIVKDGEWINRPEAFNEPDFPGWDDQHRDQYEEIRQRCDEQWDGTVKELLADHADEWIIVTDCHN